MWLPNIEIKYLRLACLCIHLSDFHAWLVFDVSFPADRILRKHWVQCSTLLGTWNHFQNHNKAALGQMAAALMFHLQWDRMTTPSHSKPMPKYAETGERKEGHLIPTCPFRECCDKEVALRVTSQCFSLVLAPTTPAHPVEDKRRRPNYFLGWGVVFFWSRMVHSPAPIYTRLANIFRYCFLIFLHVCDIWRVLNLQTTAHGLFSRDHTWGLHGSLEKTAKIHYPHASTTFVHVFPWSKRIKPWFPEVFPLLNARVPPRLASPADWGVENLQGQARIL